MNRRKLLARLVSGAVQNVAFGDLQSLVTGFGFERYNLELEDES